MKQQIGRHSIDVAGDIVRICLIGDCSPQDMSQILAILDGIGGGKGIYYVMADVRELGTVPPETRRLAGSWRGIGRAGATAILGANMLTRTIVTLVSRASTLLSNTPKTGELSFCKSEAEALSWLNGHRPT